MADRSDAPVRIGQLAERTGKTHRAIHFYEELGLLTPLGRTGGGFRFYGPDAELRIHWIDRLQELGFSLPEVAEFLTELRGQDSGPAAMQQLRAFYAQKLDETARLLGRLQALDRELRDSLAYLSACQGCATETPRAACRSCDEPHHQGVGAPAMVAAVHDPR
jgi:MerR family transcriptional regulator, copper efflux regulator